MVVAVFLSWFSARRDGDFLREKDDGFGCTLLHFALRSNTPNAVVMALVAAWPGAVKEKEKNGYIPLHYALIYQAPEAVVMALIAAAAPCD